MPTRLHRLLIAAAALVAVLVSAPSASAVVGGQDATRPYPNMAELRSGGDYICGASLVGADRILTAAHCVDGTSASKLSFVLGRTTRSDTASGEEIPAASVTVHPQYDADTQAYDVAVIRLDARRHQGRADPHRDHLREGPLGTGQAGHGHRLGHPRRLRRPRR